MTEEDELYNFDELLEDYRREVEPGKILENLPSGSEIPPEYESVFNAIYDFLARFGPEDEKSTLKDQEGSKIFLNSFKSSHLHHNSHTTTPLLERLYGIEAGEEEDLSGKQIDQMLARISAATTDREMQYEMQNSRVYLTGISREFLETMEQEDL